MTSAKIYLIPGLGADSRMYTPQLKVLPNAVVLEHQKPIKNETLVEYATRLTTLIDTSEPFILIGTSLGGILAIEMSRIIHPEKVVLISSVKHRGEMPLWMRFGKYLPLYKLLNGERYIKISRGNVKRLTARGDNSAGRLIAEMHSSADPDFVVWAVEQIVNWNGKKDYRKDIIHIHGMNDRLFPHERIRDAVYIPGGSHVMVLTQSQDVNKALLEALA